MKLLLFLAAGFTGAVPLNVLHETARRLRPRRRPRMEVLDERSLREILYLTDLPQPSEGKARVAAMLGNILSNCFYYNMIDGGKYNLRRGCRRGRTGGRGRVTGIAQATQVPIS
ncbi:hypothetical protein GKZ68_18805 [Hymenobacter sp. BRD128]|uniref:hypothetical protein n=1 Tax=Hymenobacter sp. BRD128 TaxID=2675878 RepID=UPI00156743EA|nr:hypothetical protein [Hymenobacter sp. BRD128]QKG58499.1 hypothetical protein GKZ68_18805 [Hymenobacter sp. BRD128]